jgi:hypothetical protein
MWKQRLIRVSLLLGAAAIVLVGAKKITGQNKSITLPEISIERIGETVLGSAAQSLPQIFGKVITENKDEPISQPVENVQNQTQQLIESIKKLPADQLEAVKKQLLKEFCEQLK